MLAARFHDGIHIGALSEEMHHHHGFWQATNRSRFAKRSREQRWVHVPGAVVAVNQHWFCA
jgi:hypothetical protein